MEPNKLEISRPVPAHPSGELLENYALGRLLEPELGRVETHLFICPSCQDVLVETDQYIAAMKAALAEPMPVLEAASWPARWAASASRLWASFEFPRPMPVYCAALAALSLVAMLSQSYAPSLTARESEITLQSVRGGLEATQARGPADVRLSLRILSPHLPADQALEARIVDAAGGLTWAGRPHFQRETGYLIQVKNPLGAGDYWVRLYDSRQKLLQEYGLQLR